jgi:hypothetical protein
MTTEQMNRAVAEWLGICWHKLIPYAIHDGTTICRNCKKSFPIMNMFNADLNPDFSCGAGIIRLLEEMMKREDWDEFSLEVGPPIAKTLGFGRYPLENKSEAIDHDYITTPSKLLQAVWEWSKEHPR